MWNNEYLVSLVTQQRQVILPLVYEALEKNKNHWNPAVQGLTSNIRKMLEDLDVELFQDCKRQYDQKQVTLLSLTRSLFDSGLVLLSVRALHASPLSESQAKREVRSQKCCA